MRLFSRVSLGVLVLSGLSLVACGGSNSNIQLPPAPTPTISSVPVPTPTAAPTVLPTGTPTATPTATPTPASVSATVALPVAAPGASSIPVPLPTVAGGAAAATINLPLGAQFAPGTTVAAGVGVGAAGTGLPTTFGFLRAPADARKPQLAGATALLYLSLTPSAPITVAGTTSATFTFVGGIPAATNGLAYYGAVYDSANPSAGYVYQAIPCSAPGLGATSVTCTYTGNFTLAARQYGFVLYYTGTPQPQPSPQSVSSTFAVNSGSNTYTLAANQTSVQFTLAGASTSTTLAVTAAGSPIFAGLPPYSNGNATAGLYFSFLPAAAVSFTGTQSFSITAPTGNFQGIGSNFYIAGYDSAQTFNGGYTNQIIRGTLTNNNNGTSTVTATYNCSATTPCSFSTRLYGFVVYSQV